MNPKLVLSALLAGGIFATSAQAASYSISAELTDYEAHEQLSTDTQAISNGASGYLRVGSRTLGGTGTAVSAIFPFALPALGPDEEVVSAQLSVMNQEMTGNFPVHNADLYGLPLDGGPDVDQNAAYYFSGALDSSDGVTLLQDNFLVPSDMTDTRQRFLSIDIGDYIQSLYDAGAQEGDFVHLRLSYDAVPDLSFHNRYQIRSRQASSTVENPIEEHPLLLIGTTVIPEPATAGVALVGMLGLMLRRRRSA